MRYSGMHYLTLEFKKPLVEFFQPNNLKVQPYLWVVSLPKIRSPDGSMGDGRRLRQEARDWLESSLDTAHRAKHTSQNTKQRKNTPCGNNILLVSDGPLESREKPAGSESIRSGIWHFFTANSLSASAVIQSPSDSSGQWSHRWGEKMIAGGYKLH